VRKHSIRGILLAVLLTLPISLFLWLKYERHDIGPTPFEAKDFEILFKGALGEALFRGKLGDPTPGSGGMESLLRSQGADTIPKNEGIIGEYLENPAKFKHYSELFDTAMNASLIGEAIAQRQRGQPLPETSAGISPPESKSNLDAWGHPFCILGAGDRVAVVSGGPEINSLGCEALFKSLHVDGSWRKFHETPSGAVVVLVDRKKETPQG
jgi:hypothetical protein